MASLFKAGKSWKIQLAFGGKRHTISVGELTKTDAMGVLSVVARLVDLAETGRVMDPTAKRLVSELPERVRQRLGAMGLLTASLPRTVADLCDYALAQPDGSKSTRKKRANVAANLLAWFEPHRRLDTVTPGDADDFRRWLASKGGRGPSKELARSTVSRRCGSAKAWFAMAVRKAWIHENPFEDQSRENESNPARSHFVDRETFAKLVDACTNPVFRCCLALARYGGLRCPSETTILRWEWIDWEGGVMHVRSPKTSHIDGKDVRAVPIFPELLPYLRDAWEAAPEGATSVLHGIAKTSTNLTARLHTLCRKARIQSWQKPWQNMRASRETELVAHFPIHVACAWIGNSPQIASRHYLQITKEHWSAALETPTGAALKGEAPARCKSAATPSGLGVTQS